MGELSQFELFVMERIGDCTACKRCQGLGVRAYGSASVWRGGPSGQVITSGVCDACWGSGAENRAWPSHRLIESHARILADKDARIAELEWAARGGNATNDTATMLRWLADRLVTTHVERRQAEIIRCAYERAAMLDAALQPAAREGGE